MASLCCSHSRLRSAPGVPLISFLLTSCPQAPLLAALKPVFRPPPWAPCLPPHLTHRAAPTAASPPCDRQASRPDQKGQRATHEHLLFARHCVGLYACVLNLT